MNLLNQFSYPIFTLVAVVGVYALLRHVLHVRWRYVLALEFAILVIAAAGFVILRTGSSDVQTATDANTLIGTGKPTFVEFFNNYCIVCLVLRPTVDGIINDVNSDFNILRINIHSPEGRELRQRYNFSFTPEFVLFDAQGHEVWRDHIPPTAAQLNLARQGVH
jgi:thiol-disulfide isomerase/thioredoxin